MNTNVNRRQNRKVSYQTPGSVAEPTTEDTAEVSPVVKETNFGTINKGTFSIKVTKEEKNPETGKMATKVLYENKEEPFEFPKVNSLINALVHAGGKFDDKMIDAFGKSIGAENGPAVLKLVKIYNDKLRADAKSSAYQSLVAKHKPLEGEDREVAIAKTIRGFVKLSGISVETAIEVLKAQKAVPADYTVEDYNATPLRKTRGGEDDEE